MPSQPITAEDLGAALSAFALSLAAADRATRQKSANDFLEALANELHGISQSMNAPDGTPTPAREAVSLTADMLFASEPGR